MDWILIVAFLWTQPVHVIKISVQSEALCKEAAQVAQTDLGRKAYERVILGQMTNFPMNYAVVTSCIRVRG